ncbi:MAG: hypothetical protein EZS28_007123 [Streblomastix strix]|uniref:Uncharacterized protein n=1 Tax=Streblomastix strix TaxID=222440 RepID=A0A5J4WQZ1_9EUKA|nr:MAG: hypothetical protein EZS28_007123 [Streblomastix strix]
MASYDSSIIQVKRIKCAKDEKKDEISQRNDRLINSKRMSANRISQQQITIQSQQHTSQLQSQSPPVWVRQEEEIYTFSLHSLPSQYHSLYLRLYCFIELARAHTKRYTMITPISRIMSMENIPNPDLFIVFNRRIWGNKEYLQQQNIIQSTSNVRINIWHSEQKGKTVIRVEDAHSDLLEENSLLPTRLTYMDIIGSHQREGQSQSEQQVIYEGFDNERMKMVNRSNDSNTDIIIQLPIYTSLHKVEKKGGHKCYEPVAEFQATKPPSPINSNINTSIQIHQSSSSSSSSSSSIYSPTPIITSSQSPQLKTKSPQTGLYQSSTSPISPIESLESTFALSTTKAVPYYSPTYSTPTRKVGPRSKVVRSPKKQGIQKGMISSNLKRSENLENIRMFPPFQIVLRQENSVPQWTV